MEQQFAALLEEQALRLSVMNQQQFEGPLKRMEEQFEE